LLLAARHRRALPAPSAELKTKINEPSGRDPNQRTGETGALLLPASHRRGPASAFSKALNKKISPFQSWAGLIDGSQAANNPNQRTGETGALLLAASHRAPPTLSRALNKIAQRAPARE
jgi:hypothetical protein